MNELTAASKLTILLTAHWAVNNNRPLAPREFLAFREWLGTSGDSAAAFMEDPRRLPDCPIDASRIQGLMGRSFGVFQAIDRWLQAGLWVAAWGDAGYPDLFKKLRSRAPVLVFGCGNAELSASRAVAIVGSRNAAPSRLADAAAVGAACARSGITVVSGGARGVDSAAVDASLANGGTAIAVLADSLLKQSGARLYRDAIRDRQLCLMSEVHPEARFEVATAMARNRLIYASAQTALVVEGEANRGGTWAGAMEALRAGNPIYVLKGARAERELASHGAVPIDMAFAQNPENLIRGERAHGERLPKGAIPGIVPYVPNAAYAGAAAVAEEAEGSTHEINRQSLNPGRSGRIAAPPDAAQTTPLPGPARTAARLVSVREPAAPNLFDDTDDKSL